MARPNQPPHASNTLMITGNHSLTGHPLMVGGPQIGYFYPGFTYEIDMHAPGLDWRGATSAPFPGYMLIGRGPDFATTLTSAGGDIIDQYAETLCGGSDQKYMFRGKCLSMGHFDAGSLNGKEATFLTTVHGPVVGYATVHGTKVAISRKRSTRGGDVLDLLYFRRILNGHGGQPATFFKAASLTPQTFNSFYIDNKNIADVRLRPAADPGPERRGSRPAHQRDRPIRVGGFLPSPRNHTTAPTPPTGRSRTGTTTPPKASVPRTNAWGGPASRAWTCSTGTFSAWRSTASGTLASVTSAMNAAATQDVRAIDTRAAAREAAPRHTAAQRAARPVA